MGLSARKTSILDNSIQINISEFGGVDCGLVYSAPNIETEGHVSCTGQITRHPAVSLDT